MHSDEALKRFMRIRRAFALINLAIGLAAIAIAIVVFL
jgi:hypothetical protein